MFKMEFFAKIIKNYNYFSKGLHLRSLTVFWIHQSFNKDSKSDLALLYDKYSEPCLLSKIQTYSGLFTFYLRLFTFSHIVAYLEPCVTLAYSEPCHIQNPGIFRTQDIFRTLSRHILAYSECCVTLAYWVPWHIQNVGIFRTRGIFRILFIYVHALDFSGAYILPCKKEKAIRSTNFQSNRKNNEKVTVNSKYYDEH